MERLIFFDLGCLTAGRLYCREYIHAEEILLTEAYPVGWIMSVVPQGLGHALHRALVPQDPPHSSRTKLMILHRHGGASRTFANLEEVQAAMHRFAWAYKMDPAVQLIYAEEHSIFEMRDLVSHAAVIVAPHGGQTYNVAFAAAGTIFIEVIPALRTHDGPYTVHSYSASLGHDYWMLPIPGHSHRDEQPMHVPVDKLSQILVAAFKLQA